MINLSDYHYELPEALIAQTPAVPRDSSRLMVVDRGTQQIHHTRFKDLADLLTPNDVLVLNDSKVFPARLVGRKSTGKSIEVLLLRRVGLNQWWTMSFPGLKEGQTLIFDTNLYAHILKREPLSGQVLLNFGVSGDELIEAIYKLGQTPIPPYIRGKVSMTRDQYEETARKQYQTVFADEIGSAAAPTAGLHFTKDLLNKLENKGIQIEYVTLHVGPGTFQRLWQENLDQNKLHTEWYEIKPEVAGRLVSAKKAGKRIIAVGTTATRTLESAVLGTELATVVGNPKKILKPANTKAMAGRQATSAEPHIGMQKYDKYKLIIGWQSTELFINPPYQFKFIDGLITNFHLPESSLLMLVASFTTFPQTENNFTTLSTSLIGEAYQKAISEHYRFFSFGDAMLIT